MSLLDVASSASSGASEQMQQPQEDVSSDQPETIPQLIESNKRLHSRESLNAQITVEEYRCVKERAAHGKAVGIDGIPAECLLGARSEEEGGNLVSPLDDVVSIVF